MVNVYNMSSLPIPVYKWICFLFYPACGEAFTVRLFIVTCLHFLCCCYDNVMYSSATGKRLMTKCRMLLQENQELGKQLSQGKIAQLEAEIALQKKYSQELKTSQDGEWVFVRGGNPIGNEEKPFIEGESPLFDTVHYNLKTGISLTTTTTTWVISQVFPLIINHIPYVTELSEYVFQVDEEAEGLHSSILNSYSTAPTDLTVHNKLGGGVAANKLTSRVNGPLDTPPLLGGVGGNSKSSTSSNETH